MIFIGFVLITGVLVFFSYLSGNAQYFYNMDSILLTLFPIFVFSIFTFKWKVLLQGIKTIFSFNYKSISKDKMIANHFKSLMIVTFSFGILSTFQGLMSYVLASRDIKLGILRPSEFTQTVTASQIFVYSGFTTVYAILLCAFILYPVYLLHKDNE